MTSSIALSSFLPAAGMCLFLASRPPPPNTGRSLPPATPPAANAGILTIELWPPNHKYVALDLNDILGVDDKSGESIVITGITQDEPINSTGDGNTVCDAHGIGGHVAFVRPERRGPSNGRVYEIHFDIGGGEGEGAVGSGVVRVEVPHDHSGDPAIDDGQIYDSTGGCP